MMARPTSCACYIYFDTDYTIAVGVKIITLVNDQTAIAPAKTYARISKFTAKLINIINE